MVLYLVIPCYNEQEVLPITAEVISEKMNSLIKQGGISPQSRVLFVDDGSRDNTWELIEGLTKRDKMFAGLKLAKNRGQYRALLAGLMEARKHCDASITLDGDLQDDINAIDECVEKYKAGCDIVYCVRNDRSTDSFFKRTPSVIFYKIMDKLGVESVYNHAEYRLMSRRAMDALAGYKEFNLYLRGIVPLIGFKQDIVYYKRNERAAGETKFPFKKLIEVAVEAITSFSVKPLRIVTSLGFFVMFMSFIGLIYVLTSIFILQNTVPGWASILLSIWFIGGIQLLCIGICGEYIGKIYSEVKARPRYDVEELILHKEDKEDIAKAED